MVSHGVHQSLRCLLSVTPPPPGKLKGGWQEGCVEEGCTQCNHAASFSCNKCCSHHHTSLSQHVWCSYIYLWYTSTHLSQHVWCSHIYNYTYGLQTPTTSLHRQHGTTIYIYIVCGGAALHKVESAFAPVRMIVGAVMFFKVTYAWSFRWFWHHSTGVFYFICSLM